MLMRINSCCTCRKYSPPVFYSLLIFIQSWWGSKIVVNNWRRSNKVDSFLKCRLVKIISAVLSLNDLNRWSHSHQGLVPRLNRFRVLGLKVKEDNRHHTSVLLSNLWLISSTGGSSEPVEENSGRGKDQLPDSPARRPPVLQEVQECGSCRSSGEQLKPNVI